MTRKKFEGDFDQILRMLREHSFLRYSTSGRAEYDTKLSAAYTHFRDLVYSAVRILLPEDFSAAEYFDTIRLPSINEAIRFLTRCASRSAAAGNLSASAVFRNAANSLRDMR